MKKSAEVFSRHIIHFTRHAPSHDDDDDDDDIMSLAASSALVSSVASFRGAASFSIKRKSVPRVGGSMHVSRSVHVRASNNGTIAPVTLKDDVEFYQVRAYRAPPTCTPRA